MPRARRWRGWACSSTCRRRSAPAHNAISDLHDLFVAEAKLRPDQISEDAALKEVRALLEDPGVLKIGQNLKYDWQIFARRGIEIFPYDDTMLVSYVLDAGKGSHGVHDAEGSALRSEAKTAGTKDR